MNQGTEETVRLSPEYEWTGDMSQCRCADQRGIVSRKMLRLQYMAVEDGVRRGQMNVINYMGWVIELSR